MKKQIHNPSRSIALLANDDLSFPLERVAVLVDWAIVELLPVQEHDQIRILLDGARFAKIRQLRTLVVPGALLGRARELRQRDDRNVQLFRERLESTRDLTHLLLPALGVRGTLHELQVVDDNQPHTGVRLETPGL